jgi:hypothetical protein
MRKLNGDAFQDFFCTVMQEVHPGDFVRIRPFGKLGDKGCDGYLPTWLAISPTKTGDRRNVPDSTIL